MNFNLVRANITGLAGNKKKIDINFNKDITIFYGVNGCGKTSLLKILNSAYDNNPESLKDVPFKEAEVLVNLSDDKNVTFVRKIKKPLMLPQREPAIVDPSSKNALAEYVKSTQKDDLSELKWECSITINGKEFNDDSDYNKLQLPHKYLPTSRLYLGVETEISWKKYQLSEELLEQHFSKAIQELWASYTHNLSIETNQIQEAGLTNILTGILKAKDKTESISDDFLREGYEELIEFLNRQGVSDMPSKDDLTTSNLEGQQKRAVVKSIIEIERKIREIKRPKEKLNNLIQKYFTGNKKILFEDQKIEAKSDDDQSFDLGFLSSGEKHLLKIFIETLKAKKTTIIIDEPEISIHVDWQDELIESMRQLNPNIQIIMATHSPEIISNVSDDKLFVL